MTARVRELVDRSLPTFAIPGQRVAFLKLLRGRGVYDTRDGGLSLASFRSVTKISMLATTAGSPRVETVVTGETRSPRKWHGAHAEKQARNFGDERAFGDHSLHGQNFGLQSEALLATCARPLET